MQRSTGNPDASSLCRYHADLSGSNTGSNFRPHSAALELTVTPIFSSDEQQQILAAIGRHNALRCPHCDTALIRVEVAPRDDVAYVRDRVWLRCESCGRHAVLDRGAPPGRGEENG